jgi:hypothetical protein
MDSGLCGNDSSHQEGLKVLFKQPLRQFISLIRADLMTDQLL